MRRLVLALALVLAWPRPAAATELGLDGGAVLWNGVIDEARFDAVAATGAGWVRLNFRLDAWDTIDATWLATHDRIVDAYVARGLQVIGLLNDELIDGTLDRNSEGFVEAYVASAVTVIDHFKDRVRVFEVINEPNDWAGGTSPRFEPSWFARILQDTYLEVKHHGGHLDDPCWQVTLLSGPLFSFDGTTAADYLAEVYDVGRGQLAWDWTRAQTGSFPLDGVGYHLYVAQDASDSLATVRSRTHGNLDAIHAVIVANEGAATDSQIWVSEYGWRADVVGEAGQAARLQAGFEAMRDSGHVAVALYFQLADFPDNQWGLYADGGLDAAHRRAAADTMIAVAADHRPARGARVLSVTAPALDAGGTGEVVVTLENRGTATWEDGWRIAAAPGCPSAATDNAITWEPVSGYSGGLTDARVFLDAPVAPGERVDVTVPVRAPDQPGEVRFAARMVEEGAAWFGDTATATLTVGEPVPGDDPDAGGDTAIDGAAASAGCSAGGGGASSLLLLALSAALRGRSRGRGRSARSCRSRSSSPRSGGRSPRAARSSTSPDTR